MRALVAATVVALALSAVPAGAAEFAPPGEEVQNVAGTIAVPTRFTDGVGGWPGLVRRVYQASAASNGVIGYVFDVDPETWGGAFVLGDVKDQTGAGNLDIYFYETMGDAGGQEAPITSAEYQTADKGEVGFVPAGARKGVVFTADAVNATFTYKGFSTPGLTIGSGALDLTVPAGATVGWLNATDDYSFVRHTPAAGPVAFNSSPKAGTGIPVGATFSNVFTEPGTYPYETSAGTGTITVTDGPGVGTPTG